MSSEQLIRKQMEAEARKQMLNEEKMKLRVLEFRKEFLPIAIKHGLDYNAYIESTPNGIFPRLGISELADVEGVKKTLKELTGKNNKKA